MDNQNTNGINGSVGQSINPTITPNPNPENSASTIGSLNPQPTMDAILNGGTTLTEPVLNPIPPTIEPIPQPGLSSPITSPSMSSLEPIPPIIDNSLNTEPIKSPIENPVENITMTPTNNVEPTINTMVPPISSVPSMDQTTPPMEPTIPPISENFSSIPIPQIPVESDNNSKKSHKSPLVLILVFILIAAIGFGVYYFLNFAQNGSFGMLSSLKKSVTTKDVNLELGKEVSKNIDDYATINGYKKSDCSLDTTNVNANKVSTYKYFVTCGSEKIEGTVIVEDTTKPEVITSDVTVLPNATIKESDFIEKCVDASKCSYEFETDVQSLLANNGDYEVKITVSDEYNNKTTATAKLIVSANAPVKYLTCTTPAKDIDNIYASFTDSYKIGIDSNNQFYNAIRVSMFKYADAKDYESAVSNYNRTNGINNVIGIETFNQSDNTITLKSQKTLAEMSSDLKVELPSEATELSSWLWGVGDYVCN